MMQTKEPKNAQAPAASTTNAGARAKDNVQSEMINPAASFQNSKVKDQPRVPVLPVTDAEQMQRCQNPLQAPFQSSPAHKMSDEDKRFANSAILSIRKECIEDLKFLTRYDRGLSIEDARFLCSAVCIIHCAGDLE